MSGPQMMGETTSTILSALQQHAASVESAVRQSSVDTTALANAILHAGDQVSGGLDTPGEPWLSLLVAVGTVGSAAAAAWAAWQAKRGADVAAQCVATAKESIDVSRDAVDLAAESAATEQVRAFFDEFVEMQYFIRFWTVSMDTRDLSGVEPLGTKLHVLPARPGHAIPLEATTPGAGEPSATHAKHLLINNVKQTHSQQLLNDMLGPPWSADRADMFTLYYFALKLASFCGLDGDNDPDAERVRMLNAHFGSQLVTTLIAHRAFAARLFAGDAMHDLSYEAYRVNYGLRNGSYSELIDALAFDAKTHGLLTPSHERAVVETETYLSREPVDHPMRPRPFDEQQWGETAEVAPIPR